jgi:hypothetical protein
LPLGLQQSGGIRCSSSSGGREKTLKSKTKKEKKDKSNGPFRNGKMRLFRRRTDGQQLQSESNGGAAGATEAAALLVSLDSNGSGAADQDQLIASSRSERDTLDDNNYQTVKALPAMVVINSPKSHKLKGQFFSYFPKNFEIVFSCLPPRCKGRFKLSSFPK